MGPEGHNINKNVEMAKRLGVASIKERRMEKTILDVRTVGI